MVNLDRLRAAYVAALDDHDRRQLLAALTEHERRQLAALGAEMRRNGHAGQRRATELDALRQALREPPVVAEVGNDFRQGLHLVTTVGEATRALRVPARTLTHWAGSGQVEARKSGSVWLLSWPDVTQLAKDER